MSEVAHNETQEFWRPPVAQPEANLPELAGACPSCGSEFMVGARFCHTCGRSRSEAATASTGVAWMPSLDMFRVLEFHNIKRGLQLSTAALVAFFVGLGCILAAIFVGLVYSVQSLADFQAIQLWRIEWLLGAVAAFAAGILLRRNDSPEK